MSPATAHAPSLPLAVSQTAEAFFEVLPWFTNALVVTLIAGGILFFVCRAATSKMRRVPGTLQNMLEMVVDGFYSFVEGIVGPKIAPKAFPLLCTIFLFYLVSNWLGLIPGVGTIYLNGKPALRPPGADINNNLAIALLFMVVWLVISMKEMGVGGFFAHLFAPKGGLTGILRTALIPIFLFVGLLEIVSISVRPFSLSLRLYGNIFAGETLLHTMAELGDKLGLGNALAYIARVLVPVPFYFLEILVGFLQAIVFSLLCAVYIQLSTTHDDHHEEGAPH
ncbi:MAG: F0F1 ATP synthase subunit A [Verrucomicrobiota bacterium]